MRQRGKVDDLPVFDAAPYLNSKEAIAAYLTDILESGDAEILAAALGDVARALGMAEIARATGITHEALCKALRPGSEPHPETVLRVCVVLGMRRVAAPVEVR